MLPVIGSFHLGEGCVEALRVHSSKISFSSFAKRKTLKGPWSFTDIIIKGIETFYELSPKLSPKFRQTVMDKPRTIYEVLDSMRNDQRRFDKTVADLRTQGAALQQTNYDDDD